MSITKKLLLAVFLTCLAGVTTMSASTVYALCSPFAAGTFTGGNGGPAVDTCPSAAAAGVGGSALSISTTLYSVADYTFGSDGTNTVSVSFAPSTGSNQSCTVTGNFQSNPGLCNLANGWAPPAGTATGFGPAATGPTQTFEAIGTTAGFTVSVSSTLVQGTVTNSTGGNIVEYDYTVPSTGTPEPTTLALIGSALIGLGVIGRKRLSR